MVSLKKILFFILLLVSVFVFVGCDPVDVTTDPTDPTSPTEPTDPTTPTDPEIAAPTNVAINNGVVTWTAVSGADGYVVLVGSARHATSSTSFDLKPLGLANGTYQVRVATVKGAGESSPSAALSYLVQITANADEVYRRVLLVMNEDYVPDMQESDFDNEYLFARYLDMSRIARTYSDSVVLVDMTENNAVDMFAHFMQMPGRMEPFEGFTQLKADMDLISDFDATVSGAAFVIYNMLETALAISLEHEEEQLLNYQTMLLEREATILAIESDSLFQLFFTKLETHTSEWEYTDILAWLYSTEDYIWYREDIIRSFDDIIDYIEHGDPYQIPWFIEYGSWPTYNFYYFFATLKQEEPSVYAAMVEDIDDLQELLIDLLYARNSGWILENIGYATRTIEEMTSMIAMMDAEAVLLKDTLESVIGYLESIYNEIPASLLVLFDSLMTSEDINPEEIILIKDEVVAILLDTLPSAQDFTLYYTAIVHIANVFADVDTTLLLDHAVWMGKVDHLALDLMLNFIGTITLLDVTEVMEIVDGMIIPDRFEYNEEYDYLEYIPQQTDYRKVLELVLYVEDYLSTFKAAQQVKFDALEVLFDALDVEELLGITIGAAFDQIIRENPDGQAQIEAVRDLIIENLDDILAGVEVLKGFGISLWSEFVATEAAFFFDLITFIEDMNEVASPEDLQPMGQQLEDLFQGLLGYNDALFADLTVAEIETLLHAFKVPVFFLMAAELGEIDFNNDFGDFINTAIPVVSQVIHNVVTLERSVMDYFGQTGFLSSVLDLIGEEEFAVTAEFVLVNLDAFITTAMEDLIFDTIDLVFVDLLLEEAVRNFVGLSQTEIDEQAEMVGDFVTDMLAELRRLAALDFADLSQQDLDDIEMFFNFLGE